MAVAALSNNALNFTENRHGNIILEGLRVQKDLGKFCDITLYVEGKQFRAHRNVLASCSPYFDKLLRTQRIVKEHLSITCKNSEVFQSLLNYMYTGSVVIDRDNVEELVRLANIFLVFKLKNHCAEYLERNMDTTNCLATKELGEKYSVPALSKTASNFIKDNISTVMMENEILESSVSSLEAFLTEEAWTVPQDLLLPLVTRWVSYDVRERERHTRTLLTFVDWNAMESAAICEHVDRDPLYPASELSLYAVLQALLSNNLLFSKYQVVFDALRDKFSQVGYLGESSSLTLPATPVLESNVKLEAMSPAPSPVACSPGEVIREVASPQSEGHDANDIAMDDDSSADEMTSAERPKRKCTAIQDGDIKNEDISDAFTIQGDVLKEDDSSQEKSDTDYVERRFTRASKASRYSADKRKSKQYVHIEVKSPLSSGRRGRPPGSGRRQQQRLFDSQVEQDPLDIDGHLLQTPEQKDSSFRCTECEFTCSYIKEYYRHLKEHFPGPPFKCDNCDYSSDKMINFLAHREKTCDDKPHHCTVCDYKCRSRPYLLVHMRSHTGELKYKCETCGRAYAMRSTLEQHRTSHSKEQPYLCDACGFATKYIAHLMAHKRIHTGDVFKCTFPDCKYSTPKKSQLNCHARTHEGVRPHTCHICGRGFLEKSHLVRHERIHLDDKPFKCEQCDYASSRRDKLKEHYIRHHGETTPPRPTYRARMMRLGDKGNMVCDDYNLDNVSSSAHSSSHLDPNGEGDAEAADLMMASQQDMAAKFAPFSAALSHADPLNVDYQHHDDMLAANGELVDGKGLDDSHPGASVHGVHPAQLSQQILASAAARNHSATMAAMMLDSRFHHAAGLPNLTTSNAAQLSQQGGPISGGPMSSAQLQTQGSGDFPCMSMY